MTDTPTSTSADVIEGMREALFTDAQVDRAICAWFGVEEARQVGLPGYRLTEIREDMRRALNAALALPDPKPDKGGA